MSLQGGTDSIIQLKHLTTYLLLGHTSQRAIAGFLQQQMLNVATQKFVLVLLHGHTSGYQ